MFNIVESSETTKGLWQWIIELGGFSGIVLVCGFLYKAIKDFFDAKNVNSKEKAALILAKAKLNEESLLAKAHVNTDALVAKATVDKDALLAKAQVAKTNAETDDIIGKTADKMLSTMQTQLDTMFTRLEKVENKSRDKDEIILGLEKRVTILEKLVIQKDEDIRSRDKRISELISQNDKDIRSRDTRISELETQVIVQNGEIKRLKEQVTVLEGAANKV